MKGVRRWFALIVALLCIIFAVGYGGMMGFGLTFATGPHSPGDGLPIISVTNCDITQSWCQSNLENVRPGDRLLAVNGRPVDQGIPRGEIFAGNEVELELLRDGERLHVPWRVPPKSLFALLSHVGILFFGAPFWIAGTTICLYLQQDERRCYLEAAVMYAYALWIVSGLAAATTFPAAAFVARALTWVLIALSLHLYLEVPAPFGETLARRAAPVIYGVTLSLLVLDLVGALPRLVFLGAFAYHFVIVIIFMWQRVALGIAETPSRLLLAALAITFVPALVWIGFLGVTGSAPGRVLTSISLAAFSLFPLFYIYAVYRAKLVTMEESAKSILSTAAFLTLYVNVIAPILLIIDKWYGWLEETTMTVITIAAVAVALSIPLMDRFEQKVDHFAYGHTLDLETMIRRVAKTVPDAIEHGSVGEMVRQIALESSIEKSALYVLSERGDRLNLVFVEGVSLPETLLWSEEPVEIQRQRIAQHFDGWVVQALALPGVYRPTEGVWLLGRKAYTVIYPKKERDCLEALAAIIGSALVTERQHRQVVDSKEFMERAQRVVTEHAKHAALGRMAANISHRINTTLYTIILALENLKAHPDHRNAGEWVDIALDETQALQTVMTDIRSSLRPVYDNATLVDVADVLREVLSISALELETHQVRVGCEIGEGIPQVRIPRSYLSQVFSTLVANAIEAGAHELQVSVETNHAAVYVSFADDGRGIPKSDLTRIFEPFWTTNPTADGIELYTAYSYLERFGGTIEVESREGEGSVFIAVIPRPT